MKYYTILFMLFIFQGCNTITLSEEEVNNISNIEAKISIGTGSEQNSLHGISVFLSDGEKNIMNEAIQIQLNGKPLELFVGVGNYYDRYPVYRTDDLERRESYYFEIILPDSTKYPIAYIKPDKITSKFNFPENISLDKDFVLDWKSNNISVDVEIWKGAHRKDDPDQHSGGRYEETVKINTESGSYKVSKLFYEDSLTITDYLEVRISGTVGGLINPKLRNNSKISYNYVIEKIIRVEE